MKKPTSKQVSEFLAALTSDSDAAILRGAALVKSLRAPYASASRLAHVRRVAREILYLAVSEREGERGERTAQDQRFAQAVDSTVDCNGSTFFEEFRACVREIRATTDRFVREDRAYSLRMSGDLSHLPAADQAYHREIRAFQRAAYA